MGLIQLNQPLASSESSSQPSKARVVSISAELTFRVNLGRSLYESE